jgi:hypothetical protein
MYFWLSVVAIGVFGRTVGFEFLLWDDTDYVTNNSFVLKGLTWESVRAAFHGIVMTHWHPVTMLSHILDVQVFGLNPGGHHAVNLLLHVLNTLLVFHLLKSTTGAHWPSAFVAAVFALHPLHVESVAWISDRKDLLSSFFGLLTILAYVRYTRRKSVARYLSVMVLFCLAVLSKAMLVCLPVVLLLLDYWPLGRFQGAKVGREAEDWQVRQIRKDRVREKIPLFLLAILILWTTTEALGIAGDLRRMWLVPWELRINQTLISYVRYIFKTIWPAHLCADYMNPYFPGQKPWSAWQVAGAAMVLWIVSMLALRKPRRPYLAVGWLWFLVTLLPVIGLVQYARQGFADRYMYLPMLGLLIMAAWGAEEWVQRDPIAQAKRCRVVAVAAVVLLVAAGARSWHQAGYWRDDMTFHTYQLTVAPNNPYLHNNMGILLTRERQYDKAIEHFNAALQFKPGMPTALRNMARVYDRLGQSAKAAQYRGKALVSDIFESEGRYILEDVDPNSLKPPKPK